MIAGWLVLAFSLAFGQEAGDTMFLSADTTARRFPAPDRTPGPEFKLNTRVRVLTVADGWVRVYAGDRYGWVEPTALTVVNPIGLSAPAPVKLELPGGP